MDHAFVIPAYGHSPFLGDCIASLKAQGQPSSRIVIATSTPTRAVETLARERGVAMCVNPVRRGIGSDWNFALTATDAKFVTLAHQDDVFRPDYLERMQVAVAATSDLLIAFSDYDEIDPAGPRPPHPNLRIKRFLTRRAFRGRASIHSPADKRRLLAWGNPVCCPSVVLNRAALAGFRFDETMGSNLDWEAWLRLAAVAGSFVYVPEPLVTRRIHPASETTALIADTRRRDEDRAMFRRIWPAPFATVIAAIYRASYRANRT